MSRAARITGAVGLGQTHLVVATIVGLWLTPFLLTQVGAHRLGLWLVGLQLIGYLQLLDLGIAGLATREVAYARGRVLNGEQDGVVRAAVTRIRGVLLWQMPAVVVATAAAWWLLPSDWSELRGPLFWILLFFAATFPLRACQSALEGLQEIVFLGQVQIVAWTAGTGTLVILVLNGMGLMALAIGWLVTQTLTVAACWGRLRLRHRDVWAGVAVPASWAETRSFLSRSLWISTSQLGQVLLGGSDVLVIAAILGPAAAVPYACTAKLVQVLANHPQMLMHAAAPALSEMRMSEDRARLASTTSALTRAMLVLSGAVACVIVAANEAFVSWWVGAEQYGGLVLTLLLVVAMLTRHLNVTTLYAIFCFGHERRTALTVVADGLVTVAAAALFIQLFGLSGAALGSLVGVVAVSLAPNLILLARELAIPVRARILDLTGWFLRFVVCALPAALVALIPAQGSVWQIAARGLPIAALYAAVMVPYALQGPLGVYVRQLLQRPLRAWRTHLSGANAA